MGRCDIYNRSEILFGKFFILSLCMSWHLTAIFLLVVLLVWYLVNQGSNSKTAFCLFWSFLLRKVMTKKFQIMELSLASKIRNYHIIPIS